MKKFSFSLQRLLDYKEQVLDAERAVLSDMHAVLNGFIAERESLKAERVTRIAAFTEKSAQGTSILEIRMHKNYLRRLEDAIFQKDLQIEMQRKVIENQTDKVRDIKIEISSMEKLREKRLEEYNYLDNKEQELFIEEFVSNKKATATA